MFYFVLSPLQRKLIFMIHLSCNMAGGCYNRHLSPLSGANSLLVFMACCHEGKPGDVWHFLPMARVPYKIINREILPIKLCWKSQLWVLLHNLHKHLAQYTKLGILMFLISSILSDFWILFFSTSWKSHWPSSVYKNINKEYQKKV